MSLIDKREGGGGRTGWLETTGKRATVACIGLAANLSAPRRCQTSKAAEQQLPMPFPVLRANVSTATIFALPIVRRGRSANTSIICQVAVQLFHTCQRLWSAFAIIKKKTFKHKKNGKLCKMFYDRMMEDVRDVDLNGTVFFCLFIDEFWKIVKNFFFFCW